MTYAVKEIFYTLQGEGANAGRPAVFCRFAGCNLWTGREQDRADAVCQFCDTDFVGTDGENGGKFTTPEALAAKVASLWPAGESHRFIVCTGGEPLLQVDAPLIDALHAEGFTIAIETNGTLPVPEGIDWVCVSPKADAELVVTRGDELKVSCRRRTSSCRTMSGSTSPISWCSRWTTLRATSTRASRSTGASAIRAGDCRCKPINT